MNAQVQGEPSTHTRLAGRWLLTARTLWFAVAALTVAVIASVIPVFFSQWARGGPYPGALALMNISPVSYAIYSTGLALLLFATFLGLAVLLFLRRSDEWMTLFVSMMLVSFGAYACNILSVTLDRGSPLYTLVFVVLGIGNAVFVAFLYTVPDGRFAPR